MGGGDDEGTRVAAATTAVASPPPSSAAPAAASTDAAAATAQGAADAGAAPGPMKQQQQGKEEGEREEEDAMLPEWPPQGYDSTVITIVRPADGGGSDSGGGGKSSSAVVVEDGVTIEYEGRRLEIQTILEEEELAPLFDGAYWPGTMVWPVSLWTAEYIHRTYRERMPGATFLELGCGCGVPGMLAQVMGASAALTEQPELMRIIDVNIKRNFGPEPDPPLFAFPLYWGREATRTFLDAAAGRYPESRWATRQVDFAVCCDCIYAPFWGDSYKLMLASIEELDAQFPASGPTDGQVDEESGHGTLGIVSVERRNADGVDDFLRLAGAAMEVREVQCDKARGWFIYELRRKRRQPRG